MQEETETISEPLEKPLDCFSCVTHYEVVDRGETKENFWSRESLVHPYIIYDWKP